MADFGTVQYWCQQQRGTCTQHNQTTLPQWYSEVINLTGLAENKGLDGQCRKWRLFAVNGKEQGFVVVCIISINNGPGSTVH